MKRAPRAAHRRPRRRPRRSRFAGCSSQLRSQIRHSSSPHSGSPTRSSSRCARRRCPTARPKPTARHASALPPRARAASRCPQPCARATCVARRIRSRSHCSRCSTRPSQAHPRRPRRPRPRADRISFSRHPSTARDASHGSSSSLVLPHRRRGTAPEASSPSIRVHSRNGGARSSSSGAARARCRCGPEADRLGCPAPFSRILARGAGLASSSHLRTAPFPERAQVLVCSDGMARGIDLPHVSLVVNYDAPSEARTYVHRVGRTARAGREGTAVTLVKVGQERRFAAMRLEIDERAVEVFPLADSDLAALVPAFVSALGAMKREAAEHD